MKKHYLNLAYIHFSYAGDRQLHLYNSNVRPQGGGGGGLSSYVLRIFSLQVRKSFGGTMVNSVTI